MNSLKLLISPSEIYHMWNDDTNDTLCKLSNNNVTPESEGWRVVFDPSSIGEMCKNCQKAGVIADMKPIEDFTPDDRQKLWLELLGYVDIKKHKRFRAAYLYKDITGIEYASDVFEMNCAKDKSEPHSYETQLRIEQTYIKKSKRLKNF